MKNEKFKKGKKGEFQGPKMPERLRGKLSSTPAGEPICFGYNLGNCTACAPGERCAKGLHVCCEKGCGQTHSLSGHE